MCAGGHTRFGYASLAQELAADPSLPEADSARYPLIISAWASRQPDVSLPKRFLTRMCNHLAQHLSALEPTTVNWQLQAMSKSTLREELLKKLLNHRNFNPLLSLLQYILPSGEVV